MKRIIVLRHSANKGKTKTLIELGNLLLSEKNTELLCGDNFLNENKELSDGRDFTLVVRCFDKTIGIESQGDPSCGLKERLQKLIKKHNVDYLFCATRTKSGTVDDVYEVSKANNYEILWTSTYYSENENSTRFFNNLKAKHLLDLLKQLIASGI